MASKKIAKWNVKDQDNRQKDNHFKTYGFMETNMKIVIVIWILGHAHI